MAQEYRLKEVLISLEADNVLNSLMEQRGTFESFEYYNASPNEIINGILEEDDTTQKKYIKGLISIYPLSAGILKELMSKFDLDSMREDVFGWLDISDTLCQTINKFVSLCSNGIRETGEESELEDEINKLEKLKESLEEQRTKHKKNKKEFSAKRQEVETLEAECREMERKYSPDLLKKEKEKLEKERAKLLNKKRDFEEEIEKLEKELMPYKRTGNAEFDKAMEAFSRVISTLPHDEG